MEWSTDESSKAACESCSTATMNTSSTNVSESTTGEEYLEYYDDAAFAWSTTSVIPRTTFLIIYDVIGFLGIFGNVVIMMVLRHKSLSPLSYVVFLQFLAVFDLMVILLRLLVNNLDRFEDLYQRMLTWNLQFCQTFQTVECWVSLLSPWLVVLLSCDRFLAVVFPLKHRAMDKKKAAIIACSACSLLTLTLSFSAFYTFHLNREEHEEGQPLYCTVRHQLKSLFPIVELVLNSLLPLIAILLLNMAVLHHMALSAQRRPGLVETSSKAPPSARGATYQPGGEDSGKGDDLTDTSEATQAGSVADGNVQRSEVCASGQWPRHADCTDSGDKRHSKRAFPDHHFPIDPKEVTNHVTDDATTNTELGQNTHSAGTGQEVDKNISVLQKIHTAMAARKKQGQGFQHKVDRGTISLTYISISAFLSLAPFGVFNGMFFFFLKEYETSAAENPFLPVPWKLQTVLMWWDLLEIVYLLNFCQNFYILLLTNRKFAQALKEKLGLA